MRNISSQSSAPGAPQPTPRRRLTVGRVIGRFFLLVGILLMSILIFLLGTVWLLSKGPSETARNLFVSTAMETSAAKFLATIFLSEQEVEAILAGNAIVTPEEITDTESEPEAPPAEDLPPEVQQPLDPKGLEIVDVLGPTYKGKMMIVNDPSRVYVGTLTAFGAEGSGGLRLEEFIERDGAVGGINGGGFQDENGVGDGGTPIGFVISGGEIRYGAGGGAADFVGLTAEHKLIVGHMSAQEAIEKGARDGLTFGPILIVNGEPSEISGSGGGLNPRTAIGQRADGALLLLTIDGRQSHSIGATYGDVMEVMLSHGAVNAANLDGGSSTLMVYEGKQQNICASLYGSRKIPTVFLVAPVSQ